MTQELTDLAAALVTHERFPRPDSVAWADMRWEQEAPDWVLDLRSMRTGGVLLGLLAETYDDWMVSYEPDEAAPERAWEIEWIGYDNVTQHDSGCVWGATLGEACARALLALWEAS